jgi:hypothetical protein
VEAAWKDLNKKAFVCFEQEQRVFKRAMLVCRVYLLHIPGRRSKPVAVENTV